MFVLENHENKVVRVFPWEEGEGKAHVIFRKDTNRLDVVDTTAKDLFLKENVPVVPLGEIALKSLESLRGNPFAIPLSGVRLSLRWVGKSHKGGGDKKPLEYAKNLAPVSENPFTLKSVRKLYTSISFIDCTVAHEQVTLRAVSGLCVLMALIFVSVILFQEKELSAELVEELKQEIMEIKKRHKIEQPRRVSIMAQIISTPPKKETKVPKRRNLRRVGALAILGKLSAQKQRPGGLDLKKAKTSLGPGLGGGLQGSGGIQTSLYGKGIVSAPLGPGSNIHGAGGYGTKGKGGGKAGYGRRTLIGSTGNVTLTLGRESLGEKGLGKDVIAGVIQGHEGEVRFCYEQGLLMDPKISGRVAVAFVIGSNGSVHRAKVAHTTLQFKSVEDCILRKLRSWKFPLPHGGVNVAVSYPFLLKRLGQR